MSDPEQQYYQFPRKHQDQIADPNSLTWRLLHKAVNRPENSHSLTFGFTGRVTKNVDVGFARRLMEYSPHHETCINAKVDSSVGLGHAEQSIHEKLDPLGRFTWQDTLDTLALDLWQSGDAFLEVVRADPDDENLITGLHYTDAATTEIAIEDERARDWFFVHDGGRETVSMARFGDLRDLKIRHGQAPRRGPGRPPANETNRRLHPIDGQLIDSELIHFRMPTNGRTLYGGIDYASAVPSIELDRCMVQREFDLFLNNAVPEFLWTLAGNIDPKAFQEIANAFQELTGLGNHSKTIGVRIPKAPQDVEFQIHKLGLDSFEQDTFSPKADTLAARIASAHGVPPILAGILIPGKMGAVNEGPNALMLFHKQRLARVQRMISNTLACTIGGPGQRVAQPAGRPVTISRDDFLGTNVEMPNPLAKRERGNGFITIVEDLDMGAMDTTARMREPITGSARSPREGLLDSQNERDSDDPRGR